MKFFLSLFIVLLAGSLDLSSAFSSGPIPYRNQFPLALLFFSFEADSAYIQSEKAAVRLENSYSSTFEQGDSNGLTYFFDMEIARTRFELRRRVGKRFELEGEVTHIKVGPGFLDHMVREYHNFLGIEVGSSDFPDDRYSYFIDGRNIHLNYPDPGASLSDTTLKVKFNMLTESGGYPAISLKGAVKFPTGRDRSFSGAGSTDVGVSFLLSKKIGRFVSHFNLSSVGIFHPALPETQTDPVFFQGMAGLEWVWSNNFSISFQLMSHKYPFSNSGINGLDNFTFEEVFGFKYRFKRFQFDFGFVEDTSGVNFSPDFSTLVGVTYLGAK